MLGLSLAHTARAFAGGGSVPIVYTASYTVVDTAGGGQRIVVTVDDSTGCTGISAGGVAFTSFAIDGPGSVSGIPGAHAAGTVDVVVTNGAGPSTTGTGLIEYFAPHDLGPTQELLPGSYAVTGTQGVDAVGTWTDSSGNGNHIDSTAASATNAPAAHASGVPDFVAANSLYLKIAKSLASSGGSPPDMATLAAGTQIVFVEPDASYGTAAPYYEDATIMCGTGASAGIFHNDSGLGWEAYDEGAISDYRRITTAASIGAKNFIAARWNSTTWGAFINGNAESTVTNDAGVLSNGNVGAATEYGRSYGGSAHFDGREHCILVFASAISDANITKIRKWGQQRGIAA